MNFKGLATAAFLCVTLANIFTQASAEQAASHNPIQFQPRKESPAMRSSEVIKTPASEDNTAEFNMLEILCIVSLAVAGLMLLKKIQGE